MCTVLLPPGVNPMAVNRYIISRHVHLRKGHYSFKNLSVSLCCITSLMWWSIILCILECHFFIIKPTRCTKFTNLFWHETTCFGQFVCPSSGVYSLYAQQWYVSYRFVDSCRAGSGWNTYFGMKLNMFWTVRLSSIRSLFTLCSAMVCVIQVCGQLSSRIRMEHLRRGTQKKPEFCNKKLCIYF